MINLIPPVVRKVVIKEYWTRVISVFLFVVSLVGFGIFVFALPVYVLVSDQVDVYAQSAAEASKRVAEYDLSSGALIRANKMAQKIFELREVDKFTEAVTLLESLQSTDIKIKTFNFDRVKGEISPVMISGDATTRQALADFRDRLLRQPEISDVVLPISNLAKDRDIKFSISVVFKTTE
ncbi:hypothetical protein A3I99_02690 [Candidatus Kaiserbacteria bacterium RIFCSPLOWO2_02_FULL_45_11b]|uniref:Uncharacterized protein n=1 Tax=Candidatus Kaiserbacteria bacterium RIFCSPLOWO2_12_FULL_45_26 TaxID=1798525 RepID=A0A1F6FFC1_9BACT|nr:MAG: hypothetical protein A2929_04435 [Candidatus Kaiserbacteria bacterium RIFCSPLOWO2_01_FULL_45_25]OGG81957.1 MAG: hypothetical protein A3I99_02690 [Candidatus Kaiserbacteria bacterium RIFCSPLOWO2_02_FULL_45_11b]OGG84553.1 MAG: hypothetical protein A3G90_00480 [Candidatus Kaiserbacteria bacterium RIFCSPLOWO2_12_FULL_45_26]